MPATALSLVEAKYQSLLPDLWKLALVRHRYLPYHEREEALCETLAYSWQWCLRAFEKGKLDQLTARMLSFYAAKLFRSGRRFAGGTRRDVLSSQAKAEGAVRLRSIERGPDDEEGKPQSMANLLIDSRHVAPPEVARVNHDYPVALRKAKLSRKTRKCFRHLTRDNGPGHVMRISRTLHVSPARVCQLKGQLRSALRAIDYGPSPAA